MTLNALVNFTLNRIESLYFIYREEEGRQRTLNYRLIFFFSMNCYVRRYMGFARFFPILGVQKRK